MPIISEDFIKRLALGQKSELVARDTKLTGFILRVRRKADKSLARTFFVMQELPPTADGKRRRRKVTIGDYPTFTAEAARQVAQSMLQSISQGGDPSAEKASRKAQPLVSDLIADFDATHIAEKKHNTQWDYRGRIKRRIEPTFGQRRVADITMQEIKDWHRKRRSHPADANRALAVFSKMFSHAIGLGWRKDNPCVGVARYTETAREAWLDEHDLPAFIEALGKVDGPYGDLIRFLTVTGWRISEARLLTWDSVDLKRMTARLEDTKTGPSDRALSTDAATIIDGQAHRVGFVFSKRGTMPLDYRHTLGVLRDICIDAGIEPITPHVLRHTAATWAAVGGAQAHELREAFGWKTLAMTARYVSRSESLGRRGAQRAADAMNVLGRPTAPVLEAKQK